MYVIAVDHLNEERESRAKDLAAALGISAYEALIRLRTPGNGPLIVAAQKDEAAAGEAAARLAASGFTAFVVDREEAGSDAQRIVVRTFVLGEDRLEIGARGGDALTVDYPAVHGIIRGTRIAQSTQTEVTKERKLAPGRALMTGGLSLTKTTKTAREVTSDEREGFFLLYAADLRPLIFLESGLVFESLGPALQQTRQANLALLLAELRRRSPAAVYDDRLANKGAQHQLLGPLFDPVQHLDLAIAVLARSLFYPAAS